MDEEIDVEWAGDEAGEAWERDGVWWQLVDATRVDGSRGWTWQVGVGMAELVPKHLDEEMRSGVEEALRGVSGVAEVAEMDKEVWVVKGDIDGRDLVRAVAVFVDELARREHSHFRR